VSAGFKLLRPLFPEHHLTPALSPISWRRGRRFVVIADFRNFFGLIQRSVGGSF
jgi:hypothetical protein